jgi:biopolymer transport protein ExbB
MLTDMMLRIGLLAQAADTVERHQGWLTGLFLKLAYIGAEWVLWVLLALSFLSIGIIIDRLLYFRREGRESEALNAALLEHLRVGNYRAAWELVSNAQGVSAAVVAAGLQAMRRGADACSEAMQSVKARLKGELDARLGILGTLGANAPFIGLMGTVLGIIKAARDLTESSNRDFTAVMGGAFEALVATAVGLLVAIPAVIAYNYFQRRVRGSLAHIDSLAHLVLASVHALERQPQGPQGPQGQAMPKAERVG